MEKKISDATSIYGPGGRGSKRPLGRNRQMRERDANTRPNKQAISEFPRRKTSFIIDLGHSLLEVKGEFRYWFGTTLNRGLFRSHWGTI